jgi:hypothetical protein
LKAGKPITLLLLTNVGVQTLGCELQRLIEGYKRDAICNTTISLIPSSYDMETHLGHVSKCLNNPIIIRQTQVIDYSQHPGPIPALFEFASFLPDSRTSTAPT